MVTNMGMVGNYNYPLVVVSTFIVVLAAFVALNTACQLATGRTMFRWCWLCRGVISLGLGIKSTHYRGMQAFRVHVPVLIAVFAANDALDLAGPVTTIRDATRQVWLDRGDIATGAGIRAKRYVGRQAFRLPIPALDDKTMGLFAPIAVRTLSVSIGIFAADAVHAAGRLCTSQRKIEISLRVSELLTHHCRRGDA